MRVLFTNAGRRTYMIEFALQIAADGLPLEIFVADCDPHVPTKHMSDKVTSLLSPRVLDDEDAYIDHILSAAEAHGVDAIIPLSELDLPVLARNVGRARDLGIRIVVSDASVVETCMDKFACYRFFTDHGLPMPRSTTSIDAMDFPFPCFVKPKRGFGSNGCYVAKDKSELLRYEPTHDLIQELITGDEYGVDILNDLDGNFVHACVKRKILMRAGETDRAEVVDNPQILELAKAVGTQLGHRGFLDMDVLLRDDGRAYCIDLNPRFGGGYPATHLAGLNYLKAILEMAAGTFAGFEGTPRHIYVMKGISLQWCEAED